MGQYPVLSRCPTPPSITNPCHFKSLSRGINILMVLIVPTLSQKKLLLQILSRERRPGPITKQKILSRFHIIISNINLCTTYDMHSHTHTKKNTTHTQHTHTQHTHTTHRHTAHITHTHTIHTTNATHTNITHSTHAHNPRTQHRHTHTHNKHTHNKHNTHNHTLDTMCHRSQVRTNNQPVKSATLPHSHISRKRMTRINNTQRGSIHYVTSEVQVRSQGVPRPYPDV